MMPPSMTDRDRRVLAAGAMVVCTLVALGRGVPALVSATRTHGERAERLSAELALSEAALRGAKQGEAAMRQLRERLVLADSAILRSTSHPAAGAELTALFSEAAKGAEAPISSVQLAGERGTSRSAFARVSLRASLSCDLASLALLLHSIESGPLLVAVRELNVVSPVTGAAQARSTLLQAELVVEALYRPAAAGVVH